MPGRFKAYMESIEKKSGKKPEDYWSIANVRGWVKENKVVVKHGEMSSWLKSEMGLGHVQANFMILYIRLRTNDQGVSEGAKKWAYETGYKDYVP